ncbi:hypothetical protein CHU98_g8113 [Xylaria longipes]|nr:hypothetical protein CHU98_g8113 [Xylaria longipes]
MAHHQTTKAEIDVISSRSHSSSSSGRTDVGGQATPASESTSNPDLFDREGIANQPRSHGYSQHRPLPLSNAGQASGTGGAVDDYDDNGSEIYELKEFHGDAIREGEYSDDDENAGGVSRRNREHAQRRLSDSTVASFQLYTPDEEKAVVRKFDRRLVIFLAFCYMLSFVDRSSNARIAGMEADLQTKPPREDYFAWALRAFYFAYILFEWMTLLWRIVPAHIYVSLVVLSWGVVASLQAVVTSYPFLIVLRVLLGIGEAGFAGVPFYLSFFFKRRELAFRTALFISDPAAPLASAFAGFVAWVILWFGESLPIASWRLLFLFEGFPSIIVATIAWGVIPDSPETTSYLSPRERKIAHLRLQHEKAEQQSHRRSSFSSTSTQKNKPASSSSGLTSKEVLAAFKDPKAWLTAFMLFLANMAYSTLPAFLPTILKDMGHSELQAEALSAPPNLLAFGIVLITAHVSDSAQSRSPFIAAHALLSASGYLVLALARPPGTES